MYMNEYDIDAAVARHIRNSHPNRLSAALVLANLRDWTNDKSDGWAYWSKPSNAAKGLMAIADGPRTEGDVSQETLTAAVKPVKAFLTRMAKVTNSRGIPLVTSHERERILRGAMDVLA